MERYLPVGLMLISVLLAFSLGTVFAEINDTSTKNMTTNNNTSLNTSNGTMPQNVTENATNPFAHVKGNAYEYCAPGCYWNESHRCVCV